MTICLLPAFVSAAKAENQSAGVKISGSSGDLTYSVMEDGSFIISGSGELSDSFCQDCGSVYSDYKIKKIVVQNGVTRIGKYAFSDLLSLESVSLPDSVTEIASYAFSSCSSLTNVSMPSKLTKIGEKCFYACSSLKQIDLPDSLETIEVNAFEDCTALLRIDIPGKVQTIPDRTFEGCKSLEEVTIPNSVKWMFHHAFHDCDSLKEVTIPGSIIHLDDAFSECDSLEKVVLCDGVKYLGERGFYGCRALKAIWIPKSMVEIKKDCFNYSGLSDVYYDGTRDQWGNIDTHAALNEQLMRADVHCSDDPAPVPCESEDPADPKESESPTDSGSPAESDKSTKTSDKNSVKTREAEILRWKSNKDLAGSAYAPLKAKAAKTTQSTVTVSWTKVKGASGYIVYGNLSGSYKMKRLKTTTKTSFKVKSIGGTKLKKGTYYKFVVLAYNTVNGDKKCKAVSKTVHAATTGGKVTNGKQVKLKASKKTLKKNSTWTVTADVVKNDSRKTLKKYLGLRYESSNKSIASVSSKGKVTAKKKGKAKIYVFAQNGIAAAVQVTVK